MAKQSIKAVVRDAKAQEAKLTKSLAKLPPDGSGVRAASFDSFVNFAQKLGVGADNALTTSTYGFNPITRNRVLLEWIHRGSWLGGVAIDLVADDMTRAGIDYVTEISPEDTDLMGRRATSLSIWPTLNEAIKWGRLYGGSLCVALIDGQDPRTPLRLDTVGEGQFKGLLTLDRWMVEPSLEDLVTEYGPHLGLPRYYRVQPNAPALRGTAIHHSRVMLRHEGNPIPYQQRLLENLWGTSVLERIYDRMIAFDSATTGAAQLVYKSYLRTLKVEGLRDIVSAGGPSMNGLMSYVDVMRRFQGQEGITLLDMTDEFEVQQHGAFSGLSDALVQFGQQLSGALQIPLVRLFGQSPAGLNATGESDLRTYYDNIRQQQERTMHGGVTMTYKLLARSEGIQLPENFALSFSSLWQMTDDEKSTVANRTAETVEKAYDSGLISQQTAMKELRQSSKTTGVFTNITEELIEQADAEITPPGGEGLLDGNTDLLGGLPTPDLEGTLSNEIRPKGEASAIPNGPRRRVQLQQPPAPGSQAD